MAEQFRLHVERRGRKTGIVYDDRTGDILRIECDLRGLDFECYLTVQMDGQELLPRTRRVKQSKTSIDLRRHGLKMVKDSNAVRIVDRGWKLPPGFAIHISHIPA